MTGAVPNQKQKVQYYESYVPTPAGMVCLQVNRDGHLCHLSYEKGKKPATAPDVASRRIVDALQQYFEQPCGFDDLLLAPAPTRKHQRVRSMLLRIPPGSVRSYGELAHQLGHKGARGVGLICARNPIPIIVPCHRVIASDGGLGGYAPGLEIKRRLLEWEGIKFNAQGLVIQ